MAKPKTAVGSAPSERPKAGPAPPGRPKGGAGKDELKDGDLTTLKKGAKGNPAAAGAAKGKPKKKGGRGGGPATRTLVAVAVAAVAVAAGLAMLWRSGDAKADPPELRRPPEPKGAAQAGAQEAKLATPAKPITPAKPTEADVRRQCKKAAAVGNCAGHLQHRMERECAPECRAWQSMSQQQRECAGYAEGGECGRNPAYMLSTCARECKEWETELGLTIDRSSQCVDWSLLGKCEREPARMAVECNTSCTIQQRCASSSFSGWPVGLCDKALRCELIDKDADCRERALRGECATREGAGAAWRAAATMAERCHKSCAEFDVDGLLSAQRSEARVHAAPFIDWAASRRFERCWGGVWASTGRNKLSLPHRCAAPRRLPWQRRAAPRQAARRSANLADELTCPVDETRQTPRVPGRPRRISAPPHTTHVVTVQQVLLSPRVRLLHEFLTEEEAAELIRLASPLFARSPVRSVATDRRTSWTATLSRASGPAGAAAAEHPVVRRVRERISAFSGYALEMLEPLQVVRYHPGEKYEAHHDSFDTCDFEQRPRRHLTFLIYLNDLPGDAGGHTAFPRLGMQIRPRARTALVFNDVLDNGQDDERTEHAGSPPTQGVKYAINCWIRSGPVKSLGH